jgi:hypothetical protein
MTDLLAISMLISGGLFAGGVVSIAWERLPAWRVAELSKFRVDFAHTLRRVDRLQPALSGDGVARTSALLAAVGFLVVLIGSGAWLVPLQRRLVSAEGELPAREGERLRAQWLRGHVIRTVIALAALVFAVVAVVS